ncbi:39S ribosomal protein L47 mitochondrial [Biomphalaria glabrata]|uniref:Large ribosomal subunit protein uL29m n=1 Tax=Biomphalaria glabrata TaxID=6526 RepID=A0A9U8EG29_BIOGL|nr:39S ribosomal protein L47, mitochondrial-like [Biomphalaria glabrata]KAI8736445.1 39S ribosomal protein L47; mitochondrial-like [Biomphalaria glabrata]
MAAFTNSFKRVLNVLSKKSFTSSNICTAGQNGINRYFSSCLLNPLAIRSPLSLLSPAQTCMSHKSNHFHTTPLKHDLMEFFDRKEVWGESSVASGRPYRLEELRIKSNQDLHKLWYVLLKERNMLLTMEAEYNRNTELFPSPERITKVEESMENILEVVKERNNAVSLLETGKPADPGGAYVRDFLGRVRWRKFSEYAVPPYMNKAHRLLFPRGFNKIHLKYLPLWRQKIARFRWYHYHRQVKENQELVKKFPHLEGKLHVPLPEEPQVY